MERLSMNLGQLRCQNDFYASTRRSRCRTPRLPTPDASTSSVDESEGAALDSSKSDLAPNTSMLPRPRTESMHSDGLFHKPAAESRGTASRTPPYQAAESQRPVLPSLKLLFGDELASPPRTPAIPSTASQAAPREPACTPDSYRPPSLYPNKKQKTEGHISIPPLSEIDRRTAPPAGAFPLTAIKSNPANEPTRSSARPRSPGLPSPLETIGVRGAGESSRTQYPFPYAPPPPRPVTSSAQELGARPPTFRLSGSETSWTSTSAPTDNQARLPQTEFSYVAPERLDVRDYRAGTEQSHAPPIRYAFPPPLPPPPPPAYQPAEGYRNRYAERRHSHSRSDYAPSGYQAEQGRDAFVSAPYEYNYPKTRKRSNLPKQSTEIMRAWFDQNIENPYPSEEQKAVFASATGISMTQVSNWFINHRRRCPELRDRRAERRKA